MGQPQRSLATLLVVLALACGKDPVSRPRDLGVDYVPSTSPENVLVNLSRAYARGDLTFYDGLVAPEVDFEHSLPNAFSDPNVTAAYLTLETMTLGPWEEPSMPEVSMRAVVGFHLVRHAQRVDGTDSYVYDSADEVYEVLFEPQPPAQGGSESTWRIAAVRST